MTLRGGLFAGAVVILLAAGFEGAWTWLRPDAEAVTIETDEGDDSLPLPPLPPRIGEGEEYDRCLTMLDRDPLGAATFAETWADSGGGASAIHCRALALLNLGEAATAADLLEQLGARADLSGAARATALGQAGKAWSMADAPERAFKDIDQAVSLSPSDPDLLTGRAIVAAQLGRFELADADLTEALRTDPHREDLRVLRATARRQMGQLDAATADIDAALELDPDGPEALLERGILRERRNDRQGARVDWQRAIDIAPDTQTADLAQQNLALLEAGPARR